MCIVNGGAKMRKTMRISKLVKYTCEKCDTLWGLLPEFTIYTGNAIFCGQDAKGRKKWRQEGHCHCGTRFDYPSISIDKLQESYGKDWSQGKGE